MKFLHVKMPEENHTSVCGGILSTRKLLAMAIFCAAKSMKDFACIQKTNKPHLLRCGKTQSFFDLIKAFSFPIAVLIIHAFIYSLNFYEKYFWIDIPMHFLGGFSVAFMFMFLIADFGLKYILEKKVVLFIFIISLVSLTAVLWEFFEFWLDMSFSISIQGGLEDTLADLFFGMLGGVFGFLIFWRK